VLSRFARPPEIVFVTAFEQHAVEAFELQAVDYLLKPVRPERLSDAIRRLGAPARGAGGNDGETAEEHLDRIPVETGGRTRMVDRDSIRFVEASGDYVRLHTDDGAFLVRMPISALEEAWRDAGFVRVHRRYLIAIRHVSELRTRPGSGYDLVVAGEEVPVSRRHARELRDRLSRVPGRPRKAGA
jgi:DNA-binding LytR/AlgR family response regulator